MLLAMVYDIFIMFFSMLSFFEGFKEYKTENRAEGKILELEQFEKSSLTFPIRKLQLRRPLQKHPRLEFG